jgi:Nucleotidyltransferase of unknown function (DUF6036)
LAKQPRGMNRRQLEHVLAIASRVGDASDLLVIGSQSILGSIPEDRLPYAATASIEVDIAFLNDPDNEKADDVDGAIGELSPFHEKFGYYAQGVSVTTATLPTGWQERLVTVSTGHAVPAKVLFLDPHDCVVAKLVAGREKDTMFAAALLDAGLIEPSIIAERIDTVEVHPRVRQRLLSWIAPYLSGDRPGGPGWQPSPPRSARVDDGGPQG